MLKQILLVFFVSLIGSITHARCKGNEVPLYSLMCTSEQPLSVSYHIINYQCYDGNGVVIGETKILTTSHPLLGEKSLTEEDKLKIELYNDPTKETLHIDIKDTRLLPDGAPNYSTGGERVLQGYTCILTVS